MYYGQTARTRGMPGVDLQVLLSYAYAVQSFRTRQRQALERLAQHTLGAVSGSSLAIAAAEQTQLRWLVESGTLNGELALPSDLPDLPPEELNSATVSVDGQFPVHVLNGRGREPSAAYVFINKGGRVAGVLAVGRTQGLDFNEHDVRMLRIFAMSVEHVLGWSPTHPKPEGLEELAATQQRLQPLRVIAEPEQIEEEEDEPITLEYHELRSLFRTEAPTSSGMGLKIAVAIAVVVLAVVGFYALKLKVLAPKPNQTQVMIPAPSGAQNVSTAAEGLHVVDPAAGVTVWEPPLAPARPVALQLLRIRRQQQQLFLIFELSGDPGIRVEQKKFPERVLVQFTGAKVPPKLKINGMDPSVAGVSVASNANGVQVEVRLKRESNPLLVGPTPDHHVIINLQQ